MSPHVLVNSGFSDEVLVPGTSLALDGRVRAAQPPAPGMDPMAPRPASWKPTPTAILLACLLVWPFASRLWERFGPNRTRAEIEAALDRLLPHSPTTAAIDGFHCEDSTRGWDYLCRAVVLENWPRSIPKRRPWVYGIILQGRRVLPCRFPENQPEPSREESLRSGQCGGRVF